MFFTAAGYTPVVGTSAGSLLSTVFLNTSWKGKLMEFIIRCDGETQGEREGEGQRDRQTEREGENEREKETDKLTDSDQK